MDLSIAYLQQVKMTQLYHELANLSTQRWRSCAASSPRGIQCD